MRPKKPISLEQFNFWDAVFLKLVEQGSPVGQAVRGANEALAARKKALQAE